MRVFNIVRRKGQDVRFSGGPGDSFETAVIVHASGSVVAVTAEYAYVASQCGDRGQDWTLELQRLQMHEGKPFDVLTITLSNGDTRTFYFDIAQFFAK